MKRVLLTAAGLLLAGGLFAYNPPAGGQNLLRLSSPALLTGAASSAGGALYNVLPSSIVNNPAITAFEQRIVLDVGVTALTDGNDDDGSLGSAFEAGLLIPGRRGVASFLVQGIFAPLVDMHLGDSVNATAGVSKDITDSLSVGVSATLGIFWGYESDWTGSLAIGAYYNYGDVSFMKDVRFGCALMNLGKMYTQTEVRGIADDADYYEFRENAWDYADNWPALATLRTGVAATLLEKNKFTVGGSFDLSYPSFQNVVCDIGLQVQYSSFLKLSVAEELDVRELKEGSKNLLPAVGVSFKFLFKSKADSTITKFAGGDESEMTVSTAWHNMYEDVNAFSAGAVLKLGLEDKEPPKITIWEDD
ncbi:MAG: hypothetical protein K6G80_04190 [Treponema sp.]|nr:hypothetical protein [Treponema sp.]